METDPAVREAIAAAFNVKQELYFTVREGHSMTMSVEAVRRMPQKEIAGLWRSYVEALARCMVSVCLQRAGEAGLTVILLPAQGTSDQGARMVCSIQDAVSAAAACMAPTSSPSSCRRLACKDMSHCWCHLSAVQADGRCLLM